MVLKTLSVLLADISPQISSIWIKHHYPVLELLLAAPVWRADGSDTTATAAAATPWGATP